MERLKNASHATLISTAEEQSPEWHATRASGIGGSDVAGILGLSRYSSPLSIWMRKTGMDTNDPPSIPARVGTALESTIVELFSEETGLEVGITKATYQHPEHEWARANIDGVVFEDNGSLALLECKSVGDFMREDWAEGVPVYYLTQVQHYLWVMGLQRAYVAVLFGKHTFDYFVIERDDEDIAFISEQCQLFWEKHVIGGEPPEMLPEDPAATNYLLQKYGGGDDSIIELDGQAAAWVEQYERAMAMEKEAKALKSEAGQKLMASIGQAKRGRLDDCTVTFVRSSRFSENLAREKHPDLVEKYSTAFDTRAFRAAHKAEYEACKQLSSGHIRITRKKK